MKIAVYGRYYKQNHREFFQRLFNRLREHDVELLLFKKFLDLIGSEIQIQQNFRFFSSAPELKGKVDFLFSVGGDGTLLDTISLVRDSGIPVMGINTGRLGFLSSTQIDEMDATLEMLFKGQYSLDKRTLLVLETKKQLFGDINFCLNEITVHKKDTSSMIIINAYVNGDYLNSYWADGLIVATPTGSTAYSLSCGGPIVTPLSRNLIITPIAPHNLNVRPIVISDDLSIKLTVGGSADNFLVAMDSRTETIDASVELHIKKAEFTLNLVNLCNQTYLSTVRSKLMWGVDKRN